MHGPFDSILHMLPQILGSMGNSRSDNAHELLMKILVDVSDGADRLDFLAHNLEVHPSRLQPGEDAEAIQRQIELTMKLKLALQTVREGVVNLLEARENAPWPDPGVPDDFPGFADGAIPPHSEVNSALGAELQRMVEDAEADEAPDTPSETLGLGPDETPAKPTLPDTWAD
jgi:hypothetical protein